MNIVISIYKYFSLFELVYISSSSVLLVVSLEAKAIKLVSPVSL